MHVVRLGYLIQNRQKLITYGIADKERVDGVGMTFRPQT